MIGDEAIKNYICDHIDPEPQLLKEIARETNVKLVNGSMVSGHLQGRILKMFVRMIRPKRVLEFGTYTGYASLCIAEGLEEGSVLHTVEINDELEEMIMKNFSRSPYGKKIILHIGDIATVINDFEDSFFDMAFSDGDKKTFLRDYELVLPKIKHSGLIIADNTLWHGNVIKRPASNDWHTQNVIKFNDKLKADDRVEKVILPVRDGLTLIYKK